MIRAKRRGVDRKTRALKKAKIFLIKISIFRHGKVLFVQYVQLLKKWIFKLSHVENVENFLPFSVPSWKNAV